MSKLKIDKQNPILTSYFLKPTKQHSEDKENNSNGGKNEATKDNQAHHPEIIQYNKDELFKITKDLLSSKPIFNQNNFKDLFTLTKQTIKTGDKIPNDIIDPLYLLTAYSHYYNSQNFDKILFSYALLYSEVNENRKSAYVLMKYLFPKEEPSLTFEAVKKNFYNQTNFSCLLENTFEQLRTNITRLLTDENLLNSTLLLFSSLLLVDSKYVKEILLFLTNSKQYLIELIIWPKHFNNLLKIICKMNETVNKLTTAELEKEFELNANCFMFGNKIKTLLCDIMFGSNLSNIQTNLEFINTHLTEILFLQAKWLKKSKNEKVFAQLASLGQLDNLMATITGYCGKFLTNDELKRKYLNLLGKIYNIYLNFNLSKWKEYCEMIFKYAEENKIVTVEIYLIKVNMLKDFITKENGKLNDEMVDEAMVHIEELRSLQLGVIVENKSDKEYFTKLKQHLVKLVEMLIQILIFNWINSADSYFKCKGLFTSIGALLANESDDKKVPTLALAILLANLDSDLKDFAIYSHLYLTRNAQADVIYVVLIKLKFYDKLFAYQNILIKLDQVKYFQITSEILNLLQLYNTPIEIILECIDHFGREIENKLSTSEYEKVPNEDRKKLFVRLTQIITASFGEVLREVNGNKKEKTEEVFYQMCNKFLSNLKILYQTIERINSVFKSISSNMINLNIHLVTFLDFIGALTVEKGSKNYIFAYVKQLSKDKTILQDVICNPSHLNYLTAMINEIISKVDLELSEDKIDKVLLYNPPKDKSTKTKQKGFYEFIDNLEDVLKQNFTTGFSIQEDKVTNKAEFIIAAKQLNVITNQLDLEANDEVAMGRYNILSNLTSYLTSIRHDPTLFLMNTLKIADDLLELLATCINELNYIKYYYHQAETCSYVLYGLDYITTHSLNIENYINFNTAILQIETHLKSILKEGKCLNFVEYITYLNIKFFRVWRIFTQQPTSFHMINSLLKKGTKYIELASSYYQRLKSKPIYFLEFIYYNIKKVKHVLQEERAEDLMTKQTLLASNMNYNTFMFNMISKIKQCTNMMYKLCYKYNFSKEYCRISKNVSHVGLIVVDGQFYKNMLKYFMKFLRKWPRKILHNHKNDFKSMISFSKVAFKVIYFYVHKESKREFDLEEYNFYLNIAQNVYNDEHLSNFWSVFVKYLNEKKGIPNERVLFHFLFSLLHNLKLKGFNLLENEIKIETLKEKKIYLKYLVELGYSSDILTEEYNKIFPIGENIGIGNFSLALIPKKFDGNFLKKVFSIGTNFGIGNSKLVDLQNTFQLTFNWKIFRNDINQDDIVSVFSSYLNNEDKIWKFKQVKKIFSVLITQCLHEGNANFEKLLQFYVENLLNYKTFLLSTRRTSIETQNEIVRGTYLAIFRIKEKIFFVSNHQNIFSFSSYNISSLFEITTRFSQMFTNEASHRKKFEFEMENILFSLQNLLFTGQNMTNILRIITTNPKYLNHIKTIYSNCEKFKNFSSFDTFLNLITESIITYDPSKGKSYEKFNSFCEDFYQLRRSKTGTTFPNFNDMYDEDNTIHLLLSNDLHNLPIESIPILSKLGIIRTSCYKFMNKIRREVTISSEDVFYLLNPAGDLVNSEKTTVPVFEKHKFKGIKAREPSVKEMTEALNGKKMFLYSGHGDATQYVGLNWIKKTRLEFVAFIMGCSSGKIDNYINKDNESFGVVSYYEMSDCPLFIGCLWDVLDRDLDNFLLSVIKKLFECRSTNSVLEAVLASKSVCELRYLNGASFILTGNDVKLNII